MSIVAVTQMWSQNGGSYKNPKADALDQQFSFTEAYQVVCTIGTGVDEIVNATGVPVAGAQHSSGLAAFVTSRDADQLSPIMWQVTVGYEGESPDPESVDVEWTDAVSTEPIDRDYDGIAIVTANGEQIEGLTVELADQVAIIRKRFLTFNPSAMAAYRHAVNSDTFLGWPPGTARLVGLSAKNRYKYGAPQEQWDVTGRIQFRLGLMGATDAQAWYKRWRHEGLYVLDGTIIRRAVDHLRAETSRPVLLKANGEQETDPSAAVFRYTKVYGEIAYSGLGFF